VIVALIAASVGALVGCTPNSSDAISRFRASSLSTQAILFE
jgi:hypothetical protein